MAQGHSPEEWLEQEVAVIISNNQQANRVIGRLEGISDWGISLAIPLSEEGERAETIVFYPWHRADSLRLAREDERPS